MVQQFNKYINDNALIKPGTMMLVAVSGGVDSVVLCHLLQKGGFKFAIAHVNFQLRGEESEGDAAFVHRLAADLNVPLHSTLCNTKELAEEWKAGTQETARRFRYNYFEEVRKQNAYHRIATAHHANDNIESVMLHIIRGAGLKGLQGILPLNGKIIRPLLFAFKSQLIDYANENNLTWRDDSSNASDKYTRNLLRHKLVPVMEEMQPGFKDIFVSNINHWQDAYNLQSQTIDSYTQRCVKKEDHYTVMDTALIKGLKGGRTVLFEWLQPFGFNSTQVYDVFQSLETTEARHFQSDTHKITKDRFKLYISKIDTTIEADSFPINLNTAELSIPGKRLRFEKVEGNQPTVSRDSQLMQLDFDVLKFPLILRPWHKGDYLYPLGMKMKKKKVSDILTDKKVSSHIKGKVYVLQSGEKLAGILGIRTDERFKVKDRTQQIFKISIETL